jgi:hypothetical protein
VFKRQCSSSTWCLEGLDVDAVAAAVDARLAVAA